MKRLLTLLVGSTLFITESFAQMLVQGDVFNKGNVRVGNTTGVPANLIINAVHDGTTASDVGIVDNQAPTGKKIDVTDTLKLHSVSYGLYGGLPHQGAGADGVLVSNYANTTQATTTAAAKVIKHFETYGWYLVSLPFDVDAGAITNISVHETPGTPVPELAAGDYATTGKYAAKYYPYTGTLPYEQTATDAEADDGYWIQEYDEAIRAEYGLLGKIESQTATTGWVGKTGTEGTNPALTAGKAYQFFIGNPGTYTFPASSTTTNTASTMYATADRATGDWLTYTANPAWHTGFNAARKELNSGWHAIGTQQTSHFYLKLDDEHSNIEGSSNNIYVYNYGSGWVAKKTTDLTTLEDISISPYAGILVQVAETTTPVITFKGTGRNRAEKSSHFRSESATGLPFFDMQLYKETNVKNADQLSVIVKQGSSNEFKGGEDGLKFFGGTNPEFAVILSNAGSTFAVTNDFRATFTDKEEIPVSVWIKDNGNYSIALKAIEGFDYPVYLVDKSTQTITDLTADGSYNFQASATTTPVNDRFVLRAGSTITELPASVFNKTTVYAADNTLYVNNLTIGDNVSIYTVAGQLVETLRATSSDTSVALPFAGVYVVKVSGAESVVAKVINK